MTVPAPAAEAPVDVPPLGEVEGELLSLHHPRALAAHCERIRALQDLRAQWQFSGTFPAAVEIGAHRAAFLVGVARQWNPQPVLGLEVRPKYARLANERLERLGVLNARMVVADARLAVPLLLPRESVDAFFVTFPDPWWKPEHARRRVLDPLFLRVLARRLRPGGRLYLKSDVFDYLHRVRQMAERSGAFRPLPAERWPDERSWTWTIRERKCMNAAIPFGRGYYERLAGFETTLPTLPERAADFEIDETLDPLALLKGPPPADVDARRRQRERGSSQ